MDIMEIPIVTLKESPFKKESAQYKILKSETQEIKKEELKDTILLGKRMLYTMWKNGGIGLAGPQINFLKRIFVFSFTYKGLFIEGDLFSRIVINPEIISYHGKEILSKEGCLSIPSKTYEVKRHTKIDVKFKDTKWNTVERTYEGSTAIVFQHEYDHLFGKLISD
jgi:peptide deformylase